MVDLSSDLCMNALEKKEHIGGNTLAEGRLVLSYNGKSLESKYQIYVDYTQRHAAKHYAASSPTSARSEYEGSPRKNGVSGAQAFPT